MAARKIIIPFLAVAAIAASYFEPLTGIGQDQRAFADKGGETLGAAGYAFAIWGLLFAGILAYGVFQTRKGDTSLAAAMAPFAALAFVSIGGWSVAAALDLAWLTIPLIVAGPIALITGFVRAGRLAVEAQRGERWLVVWPLAGLAGWLTAASAINILTVLTRFGILTGWGSSAAIGGILLVTGLAVVVAGRIKTFIYPVVIGWALIAVSVKEWERQPPIAMIALGCALLSLIGGFLVSRGSHGARARLEPSHERTAEIDGRHGQGIRS